MTQPAARKINRLAVTAVTAALLTGGIAATAPAAEAAGRVYCNNVAGAKSFAAAGMKAQSRVDVYTYKGAQRYEQVYAGVAMARSTGKAHRVSGVQYLQIDGGAWRSATKFTITVSSRTVYVVKGAKIGLSPKYIGHRVRAVVSVGGKNYVSPSVTIGSGKGTCGN